jgi:hypothetical protein
MDNVAEHVFQNWPEIILVPHAILVPETNGVLFFLPFVTVSINTMLQNNIVFYLFLGH